MAKPFCDLYKLHLRRPQRLHGLVKNNALVRFITRGIPGAGCHAQGSRSGERLNLNRVVGARRLRIRRAVVDYILTPDVLRNRTRDRLDLVETGRKERGASSLLAERTQGLPIRVVFSLVLFECDGVDDRTVLHLQLMGNLLECCRGRRSQPTEPSFAKAKSGSGDRRLQ